MPQKFIKKEITTNVINSFIEGNDPQKGIVNLEYSYKDDFIKVYYRNENDEKCMTTHPFIPFLWAKKSACVKLCDGDREELKDLMRRKRIGVKALDTTNTEGEVVPEILNGYTFMFFALGPMSYSDFLSFFREARNPVYSDKKDKKSDSKQYLCVTPQEQFLISTGKRFFKGLEDYDQLLRMVFDLESTGLNTEKDRIEQFGIRFNRPVIYHGKKYIFEKIYTTEGETKEEKDASELKNIETFLKIIYTFKPDIITAHNGEAFDWNLIIGACKRLGTTLEDLSKKYFDGRGIVKNDKETILKLGGEVETFHQTIVPYTVITDSLHAVRRAQAVDSNFKEANLKYATAYLDLKKDNRVYVPGAKISSVFNDNVSHYAFNNDNGDWYLLDENCEKSFSFDGKTKRNFIPIFNNLAEGYVLKTGRYIVERYLLDDLWECDKVELALNQSAFNICKCLPLPFQKCCTMGTAGQWKALMLAWSYENNLAIPYSENTGAFTGGLSRLLKVGSTGSRGLVKLDYNSLYPSIILTWGIEDTKDISGATLKFLNFFLTSREHYKGLKKAANKIVEKYEEKMNSGEKLTAEEQADYDKALSDYAVADNMQAVRKVFCNSFFGSYGSNVGSVYPWKSVDCAERTTCTGRQSLRLMISHFAKLGTDNGLGEEYNYEPIVGDTDGFNFRLPEKYRYTKEHPYVSPGLSRETKEGKEYTEFEADLAEFNDIYMCDKHYSPKGINKMGCGLDEKITGSLNISRKNYIDYFPEKPFPKDVKIVGNTVKSKKMPVYIENFINKGVRLLLQNKGQEFIDEYYAYIEKIYNYQIPLKQIASKGKVKKTLKEYVEDCKTITKAGRPKSRQAWMELLLKNNVNANMGEVVYYINTGKSKSQADVKKVTHYFKSGDGLFNEKKDVRTTLEKEWKKDNVDGKLAPDGKKLSFNDFVKKHHPDVSIEEEIILNCELVPQNIIDIDNDVLCEEGQEYNVPKYIDQFNKRITPLLVCFKPEVRNNILVAKPDERKYFTKEECELCGGYPNKASDQDTYEQLMTMEDKEIRFWKNHPQWEIPFLKECGMDWEKIVNDYDARIQREKDLGIESIRNAFNKFLDGLTSEGLEKIEEGELPAELERIVDVDPNTGNFVSKEYPDIIIGTLYDLYDAVENRSEEVEEYEV